MASCFRFLNRQSDLKKQLKDDAAELMAQMPELTENQAYIRAAKALLNEVVTQRDEVNQAVYDSYIKTAEGKKAGNELKTQSEQAKLTADKQKEEAPVIKTKLEETQSKKPLYASRPVINSDKIIEWAKSQGFAKTLSANDMHVTVAYSKKPIGQDDVSQAIEQVMVKGGKRTVEQLGDEGAIVLKFHSPEMTKRWQEYRDAGASWDYEGYMPHVTITYNGSGIDLSKIKPFSGSIILGEEHQEALDENKEDDYKESAVSEASVKPEADKAQDRKKKPSKGLYGKGKVKNTDELLTAIKKLGGITRTGHADRAGFSDYKGRKFQALFNNGANSKTFDEMSELLRGYGFDIDSKYGENDLIEKVSNSLSGNEVYTPAGFEYITEIQTQEQLEEDEARFVARIEDLIISAKGLDLYPMLEGAIKGGRVNTIDDIDAWREEVEDEINDRRSKEIRADSDQESQVLTSYTEQDIKDRERKQENNAKIEAELDKKAEIDKGVNDVVESFLGNDTGKTEDVFGHTSGMEKPNVKFSKAIEPEVKNLAIIHNLSASNLDHADKIGGLAVPSIAVVNKDFPLSGFGEISLIGSKERFGPSKDNKIFDADIYSPRYPTTENTLDYKAIENAVSSLSADSKKISSSVINQEMLEGKEGVQALAYSLPFMYEYLLSIGKAPRLILNQATKIDTKLRKYAKGTIDSYDLLQDEKFIKDVVEIHNKNLTAKYGELPERKQLLNRLLVNDVNSDAAYNIAKDTVYALKRYADEKANGRSVDSAAMERLMRKRIKPEQFKKWIDDNYSNIVTGSKIFDGFTYSGNKKYLNHTLENVVKIMKRELKGGESFNYGAASLRSHLTKQFKKISDIQKDRSRLVSESEMDSLKEKSNDKYYEIEQKINDITNSSNGGYLLEDVAKSGWRNIENEYGVRIPDELQKEVNDFLNLLKHYPTEYFEGKVQRAVDISEFEGAIVPTGKSFDEAVAILKRNGVTNIKRYKEGDPESRAKAINQFKSLLFSKSTKLNDDEINTEINHDFDNGNNYPMASRHEWYGDSDYKARGGVVKNMSPEEYLDNVRPLRIDEESRENIDDLKEHIKSGGHLDPLAIYEDGSEDGRHRAYAAKELGIRQVPVIVFKKTDLKPSKSTSKSGSTIDQVKSWLPRRAQKMVGNGLEVVQSTDDLAKKLLMPSAEIKPVAPDNSSNLLFGQGKLTGNILTGQSIIEAIDNKLNMEPIFSSGSSIASTVQGNSDSGLVNISKIGGNLSIRQPTIKQINSFFNRIGIVSFRSNKSSRVKSLFNNSIVDIKFLSDLNKTHTLDKQFFSKLDVPSKRMVLSKMFSIAKNFKIANDIIEFIPVDMVNMLARQKLSPQELLHNMSVFVDTLSVDANNSIAASINTAFISAFNRAKIDSRLGKLASTSNDFIATSRTVKDNAVSDMGASASSGAIVVSSLADVSSGQFGVTGGTIDNMHDITPDSNVMLDDEIASTISSSPIISDDIQGAYHNGIMYLVADNLNSDTANKVLSHELIHHAIATNPTLRKFLLDSRSQFSKIIEQIESGRYTGRYKTIYDEAMARVKGANTEQSNVTEEFIAYTTEIFNTKPESIPAKLKQLIQKLIAHVRAALMKHGVNLKNITPADLNALALQAINYDAKPMTESGVMASKVNDYTTWFWKLLGQHDEVYRVKSSSSNSMEDIVKAVDSKIDVRPIVSPSPETVKQWIVDIEQKGKTYDVIKSATISENKEGQVWVNLSALESGKSEGYKIYAIAANYAYNNDKVLIGDPDHISDTAVFRRTENMLSSALKYQTTRHLQPDVRQMVPDNGLEDVVKAIKWEKGNDTNNLKELLQASYNNITSVVPEIKDMTYDFDTQEYLHNGKPITDEELIKLGKDGTARTKKELEGKVRYSPADEFSNSLYGVTSLKRAILTNAVMDGDQGKIFGELSRNLSGKLDDSFNGLLYSRKSIEDVIKAFSPASLDAGIRKENKENYGVFNDSLGKIGEAATKYLNTLDNVVRKNPVARPFLNLAEQLQMRKDALLSDTNEAIKSYNRLGDHTARSFIDSLKDPEKGKSTQQKRLDKALYTGTLEKSVYKAKELKSRFGLNDAAIQSYSEIRSYMDKMTDEYLDTLLGRMGVDRSGDQLTLRDPADNEEKLATAKQLLEDFNGLAGYFPLMRFGEFTVSVYDDENNIVYFAAEEKKSKQIEHANRIKGEFGEGYEVRTGRLAANKRDDLAFDPRMMNLLGKYQDEVPEFSSIFDQVEQDILKSFTSSEFKKRFIHRKGMPGYSTDTARTMASYGWSSSNYISKMEFVPKLQSFIDGQTGFNKREYPKLHDHLQESLDYLKKPAKEYQAIKSFTFMYYMGFNLKSALVNMTQIPVTLGPFLANKFGDKVTLSALKQSLAAAKAEDYANPKNELERYLKWAQHEGLTFDSYLGELIGAATGQRAQQTLLANKALEVATMLFSKAEMYNRRVSVASAYLLTKGMKLNELNVLLNDSGIESQETLDLARKEFIKLTVNRTQFNYSKWNRPGAFRGWGSVPLQFNQFIINYMQFLSGHGGGMGASVRSLGVLVAMAGLMGLPGADDLRAALEYAYTKLTGKHIDIQLEGRKMLVNMAENFMTDDMARGFAEMALYGAGALSPVDISGSVGAGRLVPGLGSFFDTAKGKGELAGLSAMVSDAAGASMGIVEKTFRGYEEYEKSGEFSRLAEKAVPSIAMQNAIKAYRMWSDGVDRNYSGKVSIAYNPDWLDTLAQFFSFTPGERKRLYREKNTEYRESEFLKLAHQKMLIRLSSALADRDGDRIREARKDIRDWNRNVPVKWRLSGSKVSRSIKARKKNFNDPSGNRTKALQNQFKENKSYYVR